MSESRVTVLVEGYARTEGDIMYCSPSSVLIEDSGQRIVADPGSNPAALLAGLERAGLTPANIDAVFLTHGHIDHVLNIRLFADHTILDGESVYRGDEITPYSAAIPRTQVEVIPTPGHCADHWALLAHTAQGVCAVAGDIFWWFDGENPADFTAETLLELPDPYATNMQELRESRRILLERADWIIPGHGAVFLSPLRTG
jgi:glyoxylase-like metal-dependent hydrolase (beta-lactamase superfamily II)